MYKTSGLPLVKPGFPTCRAARQKYGLLEKHKDYVQRARDFHRKEKTLKVSLRLVHSLSKLDGDGPLVAAVQPGCLRLMLTISLLSMH